MPSRRSVFPLLAIGHLCACGVGYAGRARADEVTVGLAASSVKVERLAPDTPSAAAQFLLSDASQIVLDIVASAANVAVTLELPNGSEVDELTIATIGGEAMRLDVPAGGAGPLVIPILGPGHHLVFTIPAPAEGEWTVHLSQPSGNTAEIAVAIQLFLDSPTQVGMVSLPDELVLGDTVVLSLAAFRSGSPITGATVELTAIAPSGGVLNTTLLDNGVDGDAVVGDGIYSTALVPAEIGRFQCLAKLTGMIGTSTTVVRQAAVEFSVVPATAALLGGVRTRAIDDDSNGFVEALAIEVDVNVLVAGSFRVSVTLTAPAGTPSIRQTTDIVLSVGSATVPVVFSASEVLTLGSDGPYAIGPVEVIFLGPNGATVADRIDDAGTTPAFSRSIFEQPLIQFVGLSADAGVDLNGNGLFDALDVELDLLFQTAGFYHWSALLTDMAGNEIGFAANEGSVDGGAATITLRFDGGEIGGHGVDGPFLVRNLLVEGGGASLVLQDVAETSALSASAFEGFVAPPTPSPAATDTATPVNTATATAVGTTTRTANPTTTATPSATTTATVSVTATVTASATSVHSHTASATAQATSTPPATATATATRTRVAGATPGPLAVCGYRVAAVRGLFCPLRAGSTVCLPFAASRGGCRLPVQCFGTVTAAGVTCNVNLAPASGPSLRCPLGSKRPIGLNCFAARAPFVWRLPGKLQ